MSTEDLAILADALTFAHWGRWTDRVGCDQARVARPRRRSGREGRPVHRRPRGGRSRSGRPVAHRSRCRRPGHRRGGRPGRSADDCPEISAADGATGPNDVILRGPPCRRRRRIQGTGTRSNASSPGGSSVDPGTDPSAEPDPGDDAAPGPTLRRRQTPPLRRSPRPSRPHRRRHRLLRAIHPAVAHPGIHRAVAHHGDPPGQT